MVVKREGPPTYHRRQTIHSSIRPDNNLPGLTDVIVRSLRKKWHPFSILALKREKGMYNHRIEVLHRQTKWNCHSD